MYKLWIKGLAKHVILFSNPYHLRNYDAKNCNLAITVFKRATQASCGMSMVEPTELELKQAEAQSTTIHTGLPENMLEV